MLYEVITGGLCGGMCFAALDRYFTGREIPKITTPPKDGTPLFEEILRRQIDSLWPDNWKTFLKMEGMQDSGILPSAISVGYMTKMQISELRITSYNVCYTKLLRIFRGMMISEHP